VVNKKELYIKIVFFIGGIMSICGLIVALLLVSYIYEKPGEYNSLHHISRYTQSLQEYPSIDNTNWYNPDYTSHYRSQLLSFFDKVFIAARIKRMPEWTIDTFETLVHQVTHDRTERNLKDVCAQAVVPQDNERYFLWTDLQGALHSFVRCLNYLKQHNIITDDLIIKDGCSFIFNGSVFGYGPYTLQVVTLILQLMHKNPQQVFFVRSYYEQPGSWYNSSLAKALRIFCETDADEVVPKAPEIDAFLETVPDVFYLLKKETNTYQAIEVTFSSGSEDAFTKQCGNIMIMSAQESDKLLPYNKAGTIGDKGLSVRALVVRPDSVKRILAHPDGLMPIGMDNTMFKWITFSSPSGRSHQVYQFFYDTILEIHTLGEIEQWTISERRNDVRDTHNFEFAGEYYLVNGLRPGDKERIATIEQKIAKTKQEIEDAQNACRQAKQQAELQPVKPVMP